MGLLKFGLRERAALGTGRAMSNSHCGEAHSERIETGVCGCESPSLREHRRGQGRRIALQAFCLPNPSHEVDLAGPFWPAALTSGIVSEEAMPMRSEQEMRMVSQSGVPAREESGVAMDAVARYLYEIRRHVPLTVEEEGVLARHFRETGSKVAEARLVNANLRLVVKIAREYPTGRTSLLDIIQEGNVGLLHGIRKFDPERNIRLSSYAQWWIRAYILKYLMDNHKLVKVGTTQAQRKLFYNLRREKDRLQQQGLVPTASMLARALGVKEVEVREMEVRLSGREASIDAPIEDGERGSLGDIIPSGAEAVDDQVASQESESQMMAQFASFSEQLSGRDLEIWRCRLVADEPETLQSLGDRFKVSRERARQLEARILVKLATFLGVPTSAATSLVRTAG
jgi:RNA polymerase sigma-32 factor